MIELFKSLATKEIKFMTGAIITFIIMELTRVMAIFMVLCLIFGIVNGTIADNAIRFYWLGLAVLLLIQVGSTTLGDLISHETGYSLVQRLRESITMRLQQFSLAFYTKEQLSEVSSIVHKDVDTMEMVVAHLWTRMLASIVVSSILGSCLFYVHWQLGLAMAVGIAIALWVLISGTNKRQQLHAMKLRDNVMMLSYFLDFIKGMSVLKSYKKNDLLQRRLTFAIGQFSDSSTRLAHCAAWILGQYFGWLEISMALAVTGGTYVVLGDELTIMEYVIFIIMSREIFKPFFAAESYYLTYIMAKNSYERIQKIVNSPVLPDTGTTDFPKHYDIVFENVSFTYDREKQAKKTLAAINITVPEGMVTALVGPSGSGKTTLTNLLIRFYDPDTGIIKIGGINIKEIPYDTLLTHITVMMQEVFLFSGTIYENLLIGNQQATAEEVITAAQQAMIHDEIMALPHGYNTAISERGIGLSGGQRQRLAIARAFLKGADIIILDEATSNVDPVNEYRIQQAIANLAKNRTVIVIAHHLRTIKNADQIVVLKDGQVAEAGTHKSLLGKDSLYASLWNAQEARKIAG